MQELTLNIKKNLLVQNVNKWVFFPAMDMQTPPLPLFSFDPVSMDDAECAEYNEKLNKFLFQFLFFELS